MSREGGGVTAGVSREWGGGEGGGCHEKGKGAGVSRERGEGRFIASC